MNKIIFYNIFRFIVLVFIQVVLLKNISLYNLNMPLLYILFIFLLPFNTPNWLLFFLSFTIGLTVDIFSDTLGLNAAACTIMAFLRVFYISITVQSERLETEVTPNLSTMGFRWFFFYTLLITFLHHFFLFFLEVFDFTAILNILIRATLSTLFTVFLIFTAEFLVYRKKIR